MKVLFVDFEHNSRQTIGIACDRRRGIVGFDRSAHRANVFDRVIVGRYFCSSNRITRGIDHVN